MVDLEIITAVDGDSEVVNNDNDNIAHHEIHMVASANYTRI